MAAVLILAGLIALSVLVDRKVEAAERRADLEAYIERVCEPYNICPELVEAMIERESRWNPKAQNGDCMGLMQISERWHKGRMMALGAKDLKDPFDNIDVGVDYLRELFGRYEDPGMVLMVYNGDSRAKDLQATGNLSEYAEWILTRSAELEREHGK
jgi:soluble lytic murein transglycosylase-like protein